MITGINNIEYSPVASNSIVSETPDLNLPATAETPTFSEALASSTAHSGGAIDLDAVFEAAGQMYNLSPKLLKAVAKVESNFRPDATSRAGAMGIMQLMPGTANGLGVTDAYDPEQNIMGGAKYLRQMLDRFGGDLGLALGAYNAGPGAVSKHGGVPSYSQNYVNKVLGLFSGGNIAAGSASYDGFGLAGYTGGASGLFDFKQAMSQMLFIKLIEMQMNSSSDDKNKSVF